MRGARYSKLVRTLLSPLAEAVDLNFNVETIRPGNTPAQIAYGFVSCGGMLLIDSAESEGIPSLDKGTRNQLAKSIARSLDRQGAGEAAIFLAQAYAIDLYEFFRFRGDEANAEPQLGFQHLVQEHFPLADELLARLDATRAEYRTLETQAVRDEVRIGVELGTGYSRALLDPDFLDGRDPDDDKELVEIQRSYAGTFLRWRARLVAIELAIGREAFAKVEDKLMFPGGPFGYDGLTFGQLEQAGWIARGETWQRHGRRAIGATLPEDDQLDITPTGPVVACLRRDMLQRLETEESGRLSGPTQQALAHFANQMAANEVDWGIVTDALLMGYSLRVAERELPSATGFDEPTAGQLHDFAAKEPDMVLVGFALTVADSVPAPFGEGESTWAQLSAWAGQRALDRDQARRNAGMEHGDPPTLTAADCERAFGLGYGVRYVEEALDPSRTDDADRPRDFGVSFDPLEVSSIDVRARAVDLLTGTERIFVERVGPDGTDAALARPHTRLFDMTGGPMKGWILVALEGMRSRRQLAVWVSRGVAFARTMPPKG